MNSSVNGIGRGTSSVKFGKMLSTRRALPALRTLASKSRFFSTPTSNPSTNQSILEHRLHKQPFTTRDSLLLTAALGISVGLLAYHTSPPEDFYVAGGEGRRVRVDVQEVERGRKMAFVSTEAATSAAAPTVIPVRSAESEPAPVKPADASPATQSKIQDEPKEEKKEASPEASHAAPPPPPATLPLIKATYVLLGSGTASMSAMATILENDPKADILVIGEEAVVPYMRPPLSKELWHQTEMRASSGAESSEANENEGHSWSFTDWTGTKRPLHYHEPDYFNTDMTVSKPGQPRLLLKTRVEKLVPQHSVVVLEGGHKVKYERLLIATGSRPRTLDQSPVEDPRIRGYRTVSDMESLMEALNKNPKSTVSVVGGGFLGTELVYSLKKFCPNCHIQQVIQEGGPLSLILPEYLSRYMTQKLNKSGITVFENTTVDAITTSKDSPKISLKLNEMQGVVPDRLEADQVVVAIGVQANEELAKEAGLETDPALGGILVNAELEARSNIFAAGDVTSFYDTTFLRRRRVEHYDHAVYSGRLAGKNMTSPKKKDVYSHLSMIWSDLGEDISFEGVGLLDSRLQTCGIWLQVPSHEQPVNPDVPVDTKQFGKGVVLYLDRDKVVGVLSWNVDGAIPVGRRLIQEGYSVGQDASKKQLSVKELARVFELHKE